MTRATKGNVHIPHGHHGLTRHGRSWQDDQQLQHVFKNVFSSTRAPAKSASKEEKNAERRQGK
jgi:hypothetical protein